MQQRGHWVALPTVMQQHSELSRVQHCDSSNASDISVQKVKSDRCTLVRIIINNVIMWLN